MLYFHLQPNFSILSKFYKFQYSVEEMYSFHPEGYDIVLDMYHTDEMVEKVKNNFRKLTSKYDLDDHHDNIFFLALSKVSEIDTILYELQWAYGIKKRTKELANFLLAFQEAKTDQVYGLSLKTFKNTAQITDTSLIAFINKLVHEAIKDAKTSINLFEFNIDKLFLDDDKTLSKEKLTKAAAIKLVKPTNNVKSSLADFCFYLYPYLIKETLIKPDPQTITSDKLLNFYFDLLVLFEFIDPNTITSEPKDYIRSILINKLKSLNTDYQGNKFNSK